MSADPETTRILRSWLDEGVTELPDRVLDAVLDQVPATSQRQAPWLARRTTTMNTYLRFGAVAAALLLAAIVGAQLIGGGPNVSNPGPTTTPQPTPTPEPTPTPRRAGCTRSPFRTRRWTR